MAILPLYLPTMGVQGEREISMWAGLVFSTSALTMAIFSPVWSVLSDRYGRKLMAVVAMFDGCLSISLTGSSHSAYQLVLRVVWRERRLG